MKRAGVFILICLALAWPGQCRAAESMSLRARGCSSLRLTSTNLNGSKVFFVANQKAFVFTLEENGGSLQPEAQLPDGNAAHRTLVTRDGRWRLEAGTDNLLKWRTQDGAERLSLCVDAGTQEWVAFVPSGYYDSSPGGDQLAGWEVKDAGGSVDFFSLALLKRHQRRREIVVQTISLEQSEDEIVNSVTRSNRGAPSLQEIQSLLPPIVQIEWPSQEEEVDARRHAELGGKMEVRIRVRSVSGLPIVVSGVPPSGAPIEVTVSSSEGTKSSAVDAQTALPESKIGNGPRARGFGLEQEPAGQLVVLPVPIPQGDSVIVVTAHSQGIQTESPQKELRIRWRGPRPPEKLANVYGLAVGVSRYENQELSLGYAATDARQFKELFEKELKRGYNQVHIDLLTDQQATRAAIRQRLEDLQQQTLAPDDLLVLFLSGHGSGNDETLRYYFLPYDAVLARPRETTIEAAELQTLLARRHGGRVLLFIDTCHAGSMLTGKHALQALGQEIARAGNVVVFTSSSGGQVSLEWNKWGHGAFTLALLEALKGEADTAGTGRVTVISLEHYLDQRVRKLTDGTQTPTSAKPALITNFDIARVRVPMHRRRWFRWTGVGTAVVAVGLSIALPLTIGRATPPLPNNIDIP